MRINDLLVSIGVEEVLKGQGVDPGKAGNELVAEAEGVLEEARELIKPDALYNIIEVEDFHDKTIVLIDGGVFEGPLAARALAGAREVVLGLCTIGPELESRVSEIFSEDPVKAMALDGAGVGALRSISKALVAQVAEEASMRNWGMGMRAQPGQEGWPIEQQEVIFSRVPAHEIGLRLTESFLMIPRKSVSMVIGMGPDMRPDAVACDFCSKRNRCPWRIST